MKNEIVTSTSTSTEECFAIVFECDSVFHAPAPETELGAIYLGRLAGKQRDAMPDELKRRIKIMTGQHASVNGQWWDRYIVFDSLAVKFYTGWKIHETENLKLKLLSNESSWNQETEFLLKLAAETANHVRNTDGCSSENVPVSPLKAGIPSVTSATLVIDVESNTVPAVAEQDEEDEDIADALAGLTGHWGDEDEYLASVPYEKSTMKKYRLTVNVVVSKKDPTLKKSRPGGFYFRPKGNSYEYFIRDYSEKT
jgi:hypothetical protein